MIEEVLERIHGARDSFASIRGIVSVWHDPGRSADAWKRWADRQPPGSVTILERKVPMARARQISQRWMQWRRQVGRQPPSNEAVLQRTGPIVPARTEQISRVWMEKPWRWRVETTEPGGAETSLTVIDGPVWWTWDGHSDAVTNEGATVPERTSVGLHVALGVMLDPSPIMSALSLQATGEDRLAGRDGLRVVGTPRNVLDDMLWPGAEAYDLLVDAERGVLLRFAARQGDAVYAATEFVELAFEEEFPADIFTLVLPSGVRVRRFENRD